MDKWIDVRMFVCMVWMDGWMDRLMGRSYRDRSCRNLGTPTIRFCSKLYPPTDPAAVNMRIHT